MSDFVIETKNLSKQYGDVVALDGLNLTVPRHSIFGFLGPNGAGKTTTMKLLLGLIRPTRGGGAILGHDILHDNLAIRAHVGYLPQQPTFYQEMTARETLRFTASFFYKGPQAMIEDRIKEMLHLVGLDAKADRPVRGFSGGERQRLGIAQAQINYPDLLIPCLIGYGLFYSFDPTAFTVNGFLTSAGIVALNLFFYITLTLLLGVLFHTRPPLLGIALASLFGGSLIPVAAIVQFTPWKLGELAILPMTGAALPPIAMTMLVSTAVWSVVFITIAIWQFNRLEF